MSTLLRTEPEVVVGPAPLAPRAVSVEAAGSQTVRVSFETGERRVFDLTPLLHRGVFRSLQDVAALRAVTVVEGGGGIEWASGPDLSAGRLYTGGDPA